MSRAQTKNGQPAVYNATPPTLTDGDGSALNVDASGNLLVSGIVTGGDIEIGAVELKDGATDTRASIKTDATAAGTPVVLTVGGKYNASAPTYVDGNQVASQFDVNGNQKVREAYAPVYEDNTVGVAKVEQRFSYAAISTATTTTIKSGAGFLHTITVSGGTAGTIAVTDNTTSGGTSIVAFSSTNAIATYVFDVSFSTGLTVVTGAATTLTVSYR